MTEVKTRRDALKMSLGVLVGLPAVAALNACTQCSKPAANAPAAPESAPKAATDAAPAAQPAAGNAGAAATGDTGAAAGGDAGLVAETDPLATGLNYKHDKANVPANLQQEKTGVPFAQQSCATCMFYKPAAGGGDVGGCEVITTGKVKAGGWCSSWAKKAS